MMNKKAVEGELMFEYVIFIVVILLFVAGMFAVVNNYRNGGQVWTDFYAKEIVKVIDNARPGDEISLDVYKATEIAKKNEQSLSAIFSFNNINNEVCVKLGEKRGCYSYFNEVDIINPEIKLAVPSVSEKRYVNMLHFNISEVRKDEISK